jgi:hypothetical protein
MDPGTVVWLPGGGFSEYDEDIACAITFGPYHACGDAAADGGTNVYCCIN